LGHFRECASQQEIRSAKSNRNSKIRLSPAGILILNRGALHGGAPKISSLARSQKRANPYWHHDDNRMYRAESNECWRAERLPSR
jgi:hypothetical protein